VWFADSACKPVYSKGWRIPFCNSSKSYLSPFSKLPKESSVTSISGTFKRNCMQYTIFFFWLLLKVHKHDIFLNTFFAETETIWPQGPVTQDF
jgi:hypothetical protein